MEDKTKEAMDKATAKGLLMELIGEIEQTDEKLYIITDQKSCDKDVPLGEVKDVFLRKTWMLKKYYYQQAKLMAVNAEFDPDDKAKTAESVRYNSKAELLNELFWTLLKELYNLHREALESIGIRENWKIVQAHDCGGGGLAELLRQRLGL